MAADHSKTEGGFGSGLRAKLAKETEEPRSPAEAIAAAEDGGSPDVHLLLTTDHPSSVPPIAWTTRYGKSRVVYYQAGHDARAWENPSFREILIRSIGWAARGD